MYYIVFCFCYLLSLLPLRLLYVLSDFICLLIYRLFRYRVKVVRSNLSSSFPEKSPSELRAIERGFYHWFCDYLVETVKMLSMSEAEMRRRMRFEGIEEFDEAFSEGRSVTVYLGHYCNWEWVSSLGIHVSDKVRTAELYHTLESPAIDRLFFHLRSRFNALPIEMKEGFKTLSSLQSEGICSVTGYLSDQVPGYSSMHYWPQFLNHQTPTYTGAERIARILDTAVYYFDIFRPRRGYYVAKAVKICSQTKELPKFEITERYYRLLENSIKRAPEFWLWSHNRWKRTWKDFVECYPDEKERKRILSKL